jgi:hypothetical protein
MSTGNCCSPIGGWQIPTVRYVPGELYCGFPRVQLYFPPKGTGAYRNVGGHHIHAKKAFEDYPGYDLRDAFSVSGDVLGHYGVRHVDITVAQQRLFRELATSGSPNTLTQHSRIAYQAMVEAGLPPTVAKNLVLQSISDLVRKGVVEPMKIPWEKR